VHNIVFSHKTYYSMVVCGLDLLVLNGHLASYLCNLQLGGHIICFLFASQFIFTYSSTSITSTSSHRYKAHSCKHHCHTHCQASYVYM